MTNEEKRAEFIKACEMQGITYMTGHQMGIIIPSEPVIMLMYEKYDDKREVIAFCASEKHCFVVSTGNSRAIAGNEEMFCPKPARIPWDASDFDREQPRFLKCLKDFPKVNKSARLIIGEWTESEVFLSTTLEGLSYEEIAEHFTLLDGTELYKTEEEK